jgi:hypothetical protein
MVSDYPNHPLGGQPRPFPMSIGAESQDKAGTYRENHMEAIM